MRIITSNSTNQKLPPSESLPINMEMRLSRMKRLDRRERLPPAVERRFSELPFSDSQLFLHTTFYQRPAGWGDGTFFAGSDLVRDTL